MKKLMLPLLAIGFLVTTTASCKKCVECTTVKSILGNETSRSVEEQCGKKKDVSSWEDKLKEKAGTNSLTQEKTEVTCITK